MPNNRVGVYFVQVTPLGVFLRSEWYWFDPPVHQLPE